MGLIGLQDVRQNLFRQDLYDVLAIETMMKKPPATILPGESIKSVMNKMDATGSWYLPVIDANKKLCGFVSKTRIYEKYREVLSQQQDLFDEEITDRK